MGKKRRREEPSQAKVAIIWSIRIFGAGTLVLLLVLAWLDYQAKTAAEETAKAWRELNQQTIASTGELHAERLAGAIVGSPVLLEESTLQADERYTNIKQTYTWKGIFRSYFIEVGVLSFNDRVETWKVVETIDGPTQK